MIRVKNGKAIANLSRKSLKANRSRNLVAIAAIALTTLLFTALITIALSINAGFQQSNFRQCGGFSHGTFKYLTEAQFEELKTDPELKAWGLRRFLGMPEEAPFNKSHVEVGYSDAMQAHWSYCDPTEGRLPTEGTDEAATDTRVLELLGIQPELGEKFTVTFPVDGKPTTQTFILCGWWEHDEAVISSNILIPESRVNAILDTPDIDPESNDSQAGSWGLDVMFSNSWNIGQKMNEVLARHGYQSESRTDSDNYIDIGVNWGYTGSQLADRMDSGTVAAIAGLLALILLTGYLIIYNVFQISVAGDIRFYGMLKTIGTTPRQLRRIIRRQALTLSLFGIPLGLLLGWGIGALLVPVVVKQLSGVVSTISVSPLIFVIAALFSLVTVLLSCAKPGRMAGRVSPIEALRYIEGSSVKRKTKPTAGVSLSRMALANLGRSKGKTVVTILSLSLAVLLLTMTVTFTAGFDMDKYLVDRVSDFILADAAYFHTRSLFCADTALPQEAIDAVTAQGGITAGGRLYGKTGMVRESITEEHYRELYSQWNSGETLDQMVAAAQRTEEGLIEDSAQLYGMEDYPLDKLTVLEGELSDLHTPGSKGIAAVYQTDDYGNVIKSSNWAKLGDTVKLEYVDEFDYVSPETGEPVDPASGENYVLKVIEAHTVEYTVTALVSVPTSLSYRYYGSDEFVLNAQTFIGDTGTDSVLLYACDTTDEATADMENFLIDYTQNQDPTLNYESKATYAAEFDGFRNMFLMLGGALSFIVGLVGILNFFNAILTGILSRRREFAMLQSIGMTGKQLKTMLVCEGLIYAFGSIVLSLLLTVLAGPLLSRVLEGMFWFYSYHLTVTPILILMPVFVLLGTALPLLSYRGVAKQTIVERLREAE